MTPLSITADGGDRDGFVRIQVEALGDTWVDAYVSDRVVELVDVADEVTA